MSSQTIKQILCPICNSLGTSIMYNTVPLTTNSKYSYQILTCWICSHSFTYPQPELTDIESVYSDNYYSYNVNIEKQNNKFKFKIKRWIYKNNDRNPISRLINFLIAKQTAILPTVSINSKQNKLLDIGCGNGTFLSFMKSLDWETYGVEISKKATQIATTNGHQVFLGDLKSAGYPDNFFHEITLNNVLEHLSSPIDILNEINRIIKPGGEVIICVPNFHCYSSRLFKTYWAGLLVPEHLQHFSMKSLDKALELSNFKSINQKYIYREIVLNNLKTIPKEEKRKFKYTVLYCKAILLLIAGTLSFPVLFLNIGQNFCPFITIHSKKK